MTLPRKRIIAPLSVIGPTEHSQAGRRPIGPTLRPRLRHTSQAEREQVECPQCGKTFVAAAVVTDAIEQDPLSFEYFRPRRLYCDHCNHLVYWHQSCTRGGSLVNVILSGPAILRDPGKIDRFLRTHPEAAGVLQSC